MPIGDLEQFFFNLISFNLDFIEYDITNILRRVYRFCFMGMTSQPMEIITDCVTFSRGMRSQNSWQNILLFNQFEETRKSTDHVFCACARRTRISLKVVSRPFLMFRLMGQKNIGLCYVQFFFSKFVCVEMPPSLSTAFQRMTWSMPWWMEWNEFCHQLANVVKVYSVKCKIFQWICERN